MIATPRRRVGFAAMVGIVLGLLAGVPFASAQTTSPWWGLTSGERPTNLQSGFAQDEVQEITTSPEVAFILRFGCENPEAPGCREVGVFVTEPFFAEFGGLFPEPTAENIQKALEGVEAYGEGTIVEGGPAGKAPLIVTNHGKQVPKLEVEAVIGEGESKVLSEGRPDGQVIVMAENRGDASTSGAVALTDNLPAGLHAVAIEGIAIQNGGSSRGRVACQLKALTCTFGEAAESLPPYEQIEMRIAVVVEPGAASGERNTASVSGGGAARTVSASHSVVVNGSENFGIEDFQLIPEDAGGTIDTQAGSHPFQLTFVSTFNTTHPDEEGHPRTVALPKDIAGEAPAGLVGNPTPFEQCTDAQFAKHPTAEGGQLINECPAQSAVGVATVTFVLPSNNSASHIESGVVPIFNMKPRPGEPARFGFEVEGLVAAYLDPSVRTGGDYGVTLTSSNVTQASWLLSVKLSLWGVPGDAAHDGQRGWECLENFGSCPRSTASAPPPFLIMPTSCEAPFRSTLRADSWGSSARPSEVAEPASYQLPEAIDGCSRLPFAPSITAVPDVPKASTSTGLLTDVHVPQTAELNPEGLAESSVRNITVVLPEGVAVNPSGGDGLQACSEGQIGYLPPPQSNPPGDLHFSPTLTEPFCPDASKIATVKIKSPLLANPLEGAVYLASQNENPFGSLIALYIVAEDPVSGTLIKLPGKVKLSETGQLLTTFENSPQLPFEDAELHFFGGERAPLATPPRCGAYTAKATFAPWSGNKPVEAASTFTITSGPNGTPCPGASLPFSPSLTGGTTNLNAGSFSNLTTTISREDGNQDMQGVQLYMPRGLSGLLSGVKLCPEAQANEGTCGPESLIGETTVSAGVGPDPVSVKGGKVYITEKYVGAPFGLSIVNPVKAGPFDLEHDTSNPNQQPACDCIVVRAKIDVDPHTAQLTITTDPSGPHAIPHLIDGVPVQIRKVNVIVNRPRFTFNPTNCDPTAIGGTVSSDQSASSPVSIPFQVTNCAVLKFAPKFSVSTSGRTSKANGASLHVKLSYPSAPFGSQANIAYVKVALPKQLPSRLTTLQKACVAAVFEANPASCPPASIIGHAIVYTPLLPVPLTGPAIFVSHGGEQFPSLTIVLQGYGVTVELVGSTFISKGGITTTTFKTAPDVPFETFELTLPQGPYSALSANTNLCATTRLVGVVKKRVPVRKRGRTTHQLRKVRRAVTTKLTMPAEFVAQNGAQVRQSTKIAVTGCPAHKPKRTAAGRHRKASKSRNRMTVRGPEEGKQTAKVLDRHVRGL
jgi:hypothetical protein